MYNIYGYKSQSQIVAMLVTIFIMTLTFLETPWNIYGEFVLSKNPTVKTNLIHGKKVGSTALINGRRRIGIKIKFKFFELIFTVYLRK